MNSHDLGRLLLSLPEQPEVINMDGEAITGAEPSTFDQAGETFACIVLEDG